MQFNVTFQYDGAGAEPLSLRDDNSSTSSLTRPVYGFLNGRTGIFIKLFPVGKVCDIKRSVGDCRLFDLADDNFSFRPVRLAVLFRRTGMIDSSRTGQHNAEYDGSRQRQDVQADSSHCFRYSFICMRIGKIMYRIHVEFVSIFLFPLFHIQRHYEKTSGWIGTGSASSISASVY